MQEATPTLRAFLKRRADLGYAIALALGFATLSLGLAALIDFVS